MCIGYFFFKRKNPVYFDVITQCEQKINLNTYVYLVEVKKENISESNKGQYYRLSMLSKKPEKIGLCQDPLTREKYYWEVPISNLLRKRNDEFLFPQNRLNSQPLSLEQVRHYLQLDPTLLNRNMFSVSTNTKVSAPRQYEEAYYDTLGYAACLI